MLIHGNLWEEIAKSPPHILAFTGNSTCRNDGALVMGRGLARQIRDRYPGVDLLLGKRIGQPGRINPDYLVKGILWQDNLRIAAIQVKRFWGDHGQPYQWELTERSLTRWAEILSGRPELQSIVMNCPLIGNGGFNHRKEEVFAMVDRLIPMIKVFYL